MHKDPEVIPQKESQREKKDTKHRLEGVVHV